MMPIGTNPLIQRLLKVAVPYSLHYIKMIFQGEDHWVDSRDKLGKNSHIEAKVALWDTFEKGIENFCYSIRVSNNNTHKGRNTYDEIKKYPNFALFDDLKVIGFSFMEADWAYQNIAQHMYEAFEEHFKQKFIKQGKMK